MDAEVKGMYTTLKLTFEAKIATLTLSRAEKRNAISHQLIDEFLAALQEVEHSAGAGADCGRRGQGILRRDGPGRPAGAGDADGGGEPSPQPAHRDAVPLALRFPEDDDCGGERRGHCGRRGAGYAVRLYPGRRRRRASVIPRCGLDLCRRWFRHFCCGRWARNMPAICC